MALGAIAPILSAITAGMSVIHSASQSSKNESLQDQAAKQRNQIYDTAMKNWNTPGAPQAALGSVGGTPTGGGGVGGLGTGGMGGANPMNPGGQKSPMGSPQLGGLAGLGR